jgi:dTDP-4-dehydrorhamnose reductase
VIGGDGGIGRSLASGLRASGWAVTSTSRRTGQGAHLDLARPPVGDWLDGHYDVTILCAAITSIAACERDPDTARLVNVTHTVELARRLASSDSFIIFLSSNLVFDGSVPGLGPDSPVNPQCVYGRLKAEAEFALQDAIDALAVVRLTKVIGPETMLFRQWFERLEAGLPIEPFDDAVMAPISDRFAVDGLLAVADRRSRGVFHLSAETDITYGAAARHLARAVGAVDAKILPRSWRTAGLSAAAMPQHTWLDSSTTRAHLGLASCPPYRAFETLLAWWSAFSGSRSLESR